MSSTMSAFHWRTGEPSEITKALGKTQTAPKTPAPPITFSKRNHTSSIASAEKIKRKPGVGASASV